MRYKCIKTFAPDPEYGADCRKGRFYEVEDDNGDYRIDPTENGSSVLFSKEELEEHFVLAKGA
jgi:hypothetical protein